MAALINQFWPILLPTALGGIAVYLLLPRAQRFPPLYGAAFAGLAIVAAGALVIRSEEVVVETVLFYIFAGLAVLFGGMMLTQRNPVHAALSFAMVVLSTCGLFLLQAAPFLMAATIIIYAGAIVVTFLFVIMLAQQGGLSNADQRSREPFLATVAGFVLLGSLLCVLHKSYSGLDHFIARAQLASEAATLAQWQEILGKDDTYFVDFRKAVWRTGGPSIEPSARDRARLAADIAESQRLWNAVKPPEDGSPREPSAVAIAEFKLALQVVCQSAVVVRDAQGSLTPSAEPLSTNSGYPASAVRQYDEQGKPKERLPAANVVGLGKALFTDYLLATELAGTLLLVATIGAIAIAGRRKEGLR